MIKVVSFKICPFVQHRADIIRRYTGYDFLAKYQKSKRGKWL
jgi:hypothetical protein